MLKSRHFFSWTLFALCVLFSSCRTQFEHIQASGEPSLWLKSAYDYYNKGQFNRAQALFEQSLSAYRGKQEAEEIYFHYAYTYYKLKDFVLGAYYFKSFAGTFNNSAHREEAEYMSAFCNYKMSPDPKLEQSYSQKAIDEFQSFVNNWPNSKRVPECNKLIDELRNKLEQKAFNEGKLYYVTGSFQAATHSLENTLKDFPGTKYEEEIRYLIAKASFELAANSIPAKREERKELALQNCQLFLQKHPKSKYAKEIKLTTKSLQSTLHTSKL